MVDINTATGHAGGGSILAIIEIRFRFIDPATELDQALAVRLPVFVGEQGVPESIEQDEHDLGSTHLVAYDGEISVATGRYYPAGGGVVKIGRMAVLKEYRLRGLGSRLLRRLEAEATRTGATEAILSAQIDVLAFYLSLGYSREGEVFEEAGIAHVAMRRRL